MPDTTMPIDITVRPSATLTRAELDEIWAVTDRYVETQRDLYEQTLMSAPEVGLWRTRAGQLVGLVSLDTYRTAYDGRESIVFYTSSVVIDTAYRGRNLVAQTGWRMLLREKLKRPWLPAYWLFDTFSYKSYHILPHYFAEYWPRRDVPTPARVTGFIDHLAKHRYGDHWVPERGIVTSSGWKRLRPTTAPIDDHTRDDPNVRFFEEANPGHAEGDKLVCLAPLTAPNVGGALSRAFFRARKPKPQ